MQNMRESNGPSFQIIAGLLFLMSLGVAFVVIGLWGVENVQNGWWIKGPIAFLSFIGGFLLVEAGLRKVRHRYDMAVARQEQELGRPLSIKELKDLKRNLFNSSIKHRNGPYFSYPLMRLLVEVLLLTVPAVILLGYLVALGAFGIGASTAMLVAELTGQSLDQL
jgi:hypothetical protein